MNKLLLVFVTLFITGCDLLPCCTTCTDTIAAVGGCDYHGLCGIRTLDGHVLNYYFPVVGQQITFTNQEGCKK